MKETEKQLTEVVAESRENAIREATGEKSFEKNKFGSNNSKC